jgi:hypothetical protein
MKYEKPTIMDLGERARRVDGANTPNVCYPGSGAGWTDPNGTACQPGGDPGNWEACITGGQAPSHLVPGDLCVAGGTPGAYTNDCYSGGAAYACNAGATPQYVDFRCEVGPSFVAP